MVVIVLTDSPPKIRGDLSKWLLEVNTGVYVGNVSARVREELWERVCECLKTGRATMVYTAQGEQKMDFRVHNSAWEPVDFDGIKLMKHPVPGKIREQDAPLTKKGFSKASKYSYANKQIVSKGEKSRLNEYTIIDLETTGLSCENDSIIEMAALRIVDGKVREEFEKLVKCKSLLPKNIVDLTGITDKMLENDGEEISVVLDEFISFCNTENIVGYNVIFDLNFVQYAFKHLQKSMPNNLRAVDIMKIAKRKIKGISNYKMETIAKYFDMDISATHRALQDCYLSYELYCKLNEML